MYFAVDVYSMGLSISVVGVWLAKIPRLVWPIVITAIVSFRSFICLLTLLEWGYRFTVYPDIVRTRRPRERPTLLTRHTHRIAGANSFSSSLEDFMNVLGYWVSSSLASMNSVPITYHPSHSASHLRSRRPRRTLHFPQRQILKL